MARSAQRLLGTKGPAGPVIVGLETGGETLGVSLWRLPEAVGDPVDSWRLLDDRRSHRGHRHASSVLGWLDGMLDDHALERSDIALVACGRGPGGFTGVRVGMATALGLATGLQRPVWPVDSLAALAMAAGPQEGLVVPLIDARRGEVYGAAYRVTSGELPEQITEHRVAPVAEIVTEIREATSGDVPLVMLGSGALLHGVASSLPADRHVPSAGMVALLAGSQWESSGRDADSAPPFDPAYVRPSDAEMEAGSS